jgi:putative membrane protein
MIALNQIDVSSWPGLAVITLAAAGYAVATETQAERGRAWPRWRTASFYAGLCLLTIGIIPDLQPALGGEFRRHMLQHLLIGMYAPLAVALGAPLTLALRTLNRSNAAMVGRALRTPSLRIAGNAYVLLAANIAGLVVLYFTPLYRATAESDWLHVAVHVHLFVVGYLFAWVVAGADPAPGRPSVPRRLVVIGAAILAHAVVAQLIYAGTWVRIPATTAELRSGGDLMYFGGDIAELLLALAVLTTWKVRPSLSPQSPDVPLEHEHSVAASSGSRPPDL